jgi:MipA family protein
MKWFWLFLFFSVPTQASPTYLPLWEYGIGAGSLFFQDYPASDESNTWTLPFPTFQYRGRSVRADDRDGARAYLLRKSNWSLEIGGGGLATLKSADNKARQDMDNIPWGFQIGPQMVARLSDEFQLKIGTYQAVNTDFRFTKTSGLLSEIKLVWLIDKKLDELFKIGKSKGRISFSVDGGSKEFLSTYFEVSKTDARADRPYYEARAGLLSYEIAYFQAIDLRPWGFYFGISRVHYDISANRESPLHKQDHSLKGFFGITFLLGESESPGIPEEETEGAIPRMTINRRFQP